MDTYINRIIEKDLISSLENNPVTGIVGPRQSGKSTLAKRIIQNIENTIYLDLERPSDLQKLEDAEWFFSSNKTSFFCIDEIQRKPDLFPTIRSLVDEWGVNKKFLILGSASRDLLRQSSESLAGRISYLKLSPFLWNEIKETVSIEDYINRGGFPRSLLKEQDEISFKWREDFIGTFLERDLLQWSGFSPETMRRLWQMLAHSNGQTINYSVLGKSLGVSNVTIRNYIDLLESTFMLEVIKPYKSNSGKRIVKSPKIYISDSGISNALLNLNNFEQIMGSPVIGSLWEQIVLSNIKGEFPNAQINFYRTAAGAEIDFVLNLKNKIYAIECKSSLSPSVTKGFYNSIEDIKPEKSFIVAPVSEGWSFKKNISIVSLSELILSLK